MKTKLLPFILILTINASAQIPLTGMIAGYSFSGNANDVSGNGHNGTVTGATLTTGRTGVANTAYHFNGTSDYILVSNTASLTPTLITMCAVVKPEGYYYGSCQVSSVFYKGASDNATGHYALGYSDNAYDNNNCSNLDTLHQTFFGKISTNQPSLAPQVYTPYVAKNSWYCVVSTFDGDSIMLYIDGVRKYSVYAPTPLGSNSEDLAIGHTLNGSFPYWFHGIIDDVRIYNRVLTPTEIQQYCSTVEGIDEQNNIASHITVNTFVNGNYELVFDKNFEAVQINVTTTLGQYVYSAKINGRAMNSHEIIDLSGFSQGIYLLQVKTNEGQFSTKLFRN